MYTPLYIKSNYSLLSSLITIDDLISFCIEHNITEIALCDDDLTYVMSFYKKCKANNIKPIIGLDLIVDGLSILLYAKNYIGYQSLIKLSTLKYSREITINDLSKYNKEVICILPFSSIKKYKELKDIYLDIYLGYQNKGEEKIVSELTDNIVFLNKILYLKEDEKTYLKYLYMIRDSKTISDDIIISDEINYYIDNNEVINISSNKGLNNTKIIADLCNFEFINNGVLLPIYETGGGTSDEYLEKLSIKGLQKRFNNEIKDNYKERLLYELSVIKKMGFSNYFLVVYDFIKYAKQNNILVGPGRGSAVGSLVAYSLGITDIDPLKYDLLFERFLNPERISMPDIDTDFPDVYRDQVINYVREKYGDKKVAGIITFGTLSTRLVIRDVGRVLNANSKDIDYLCKRVPTISKQKIEYFYKNDIEFRSMIDSDEKLRLLYKICNKIEGFPRHTSMHAAGIIMSKVDLDTVVPLVKNNDIYLSGYTMEYLEELGLIKMDFLGLKNLTTIMNIIKDIEEKENISINFSNIPFGNKETIELFKRADTLGIFQFETDGMRAFIRKLKPNNIDDLIAAVALFRPGAAVNIDSYILRKQGKEPITYLDDSLKDILSSTYGVIIYQEQIMQIASTFAGFSLGEADILRKAMSKKKKDILVSQEEKFIIGSVKKGHTKEKAKEIFDLILNFANYGFNKSHSVAYSIIAYRMAYLKAKYPKYFFSNLMSSATGDNDKIKNYLDEARRLNIKILLPSITKSSNHFVVESNGIRFPLSHIKNIGSIISNDIINKRREFTDIFDCISTILSKNINKSILESLIYTSCFDEFGYNKRTLIENIDALINYANLSIDLDPSLILKPEIEEKEEYTKEYLMEKEKDLFGFYLSEYPTTRYKIEYKTINSNEIENYFNKTIDLVLLVDKVKEVKTKKDDIMAFASGSDEYGTCSLTFFPKTYEKYQVKKGNIILIRGTVERRLDKYQIVVDKIKFLN